MSYVTQEYYDKTFQGEPVDDADFPSLLDRAEEIIEELTRYRVNSLTIGTYSPGVQEAVKRAVCAQIEYLDANGGSDLDNGTDLQSAGLGKYNYTRSQSASGGSEQSVYAPKARRILYPTGLLFRGGDCI